MLMAPHQKKTHVSDGTAASEAKSGHDTRCKTSVTELDEKGPESRRRGDGTADRVTVGDVAWVVRHSCQPRSSRGVSGPMHFELLK